MSETDGQHIGNYAVIRLLGKGGYAEVYLGQHRYLKTEAAIKIFPSFTTEEDRKAFLSEAQVMARLIHPHIVRILEGSVERGIPYLVMDYAPNGTLREVHPNGEQLDLETILAYVKDVAGALQYAHQEQLIHRDIKPGNLLLGRHREVLLSDFGLAVESHRSHTQPRSEVAGTVAYMAPEQIEGRPCPPSDQYSLGVVVYEWLSGAWPFQGTVRDIVGQHLMHTPPPLRAKLPLLSEAVERVVLRALAKKPEDRYETMLDFARALEHAIHPGQSVRSRPLIVPIELPKVTANLVPQNLDLSAPEVIDSITPDQLIEAPTRPARPNEAKKAPLHSPTPPTLPTPQETSRPVPPRPQPAVEKLPLGTTLLTYRGHGGAVTALAWSPNGGRIASGSWDSTIHLWEVTTGTRLLFYRGHMAGVTAVAWSPDRKSLASGSEDGVIQIWEAVTGKTLYTYPGHNEAITALAWSHDGRYVASASTDNTVQVWKPNSPAKPFIYKGHRTIVEVIRWSPDRKRITTVGRDQTMQQWDTVSGANVFTTRNPDAPGRAAAWSPDGEQMASGNEDGMVILKEGASGKLLIVYRSHVQKVLVVAWSPDGNKIASGGVDQTVQIWQAR